MRKTRGGGGGGGKKPPTRMVEVTLHLEVPAGLEEDDIDEQLMEVIDAADPKYGGAGFWSDSRCDSVRNI